MIAAALGLLVAFAGTEPAPSERGPIVEVELAPCVTLEREGFVELLRLEFGPTIEVSLRERGDGSEAGEVTVSIDCSEAGSTLALRDPITAKTMQRELSVAPNADAASRRAIALAVVEFVRASWLELELRDEPAVEAAAPPVPLAPVEPAAAVVERARQRSVRSWPSWVISAGPRAQVFAAQPAAHAGAQVRVRHRPRSLFGWSVDGSALAGRERVGVGTVATALTQVGAVAFAHAQRRQFVALFGLGGRLGAVHVRGDPTPASGLVGRRYWRPLVGVLALARFELPLPRSLRLASELELGWVTSPVRVRAAGAPVFALAGPWVAVGVELGFAWPTR